MAPDGVTLPFPRMSVFPAMPAPPVRADRLRSAPRARRLPVLLLLGIFLAASGFAQGGFGDNFPSDRMRELDRAMIFFPPTPPPLGRLFSRASPVNGGSRPPAPEAVAG